MKSDNLVQDATPGIRRLFVRKLHGRFDLNIELKPGLNVLHGRNGTGKSTLLHILANLFDHDIARFHHLRFSSLVVEDFGGRTVEIRRTGDEINMPLQLLISGDPVQAFSRDDSPEPSTELLLHEHLPGRPVYLPAFRSILEAIATRNPHSGAEEALSDAELDRMVKHELRYSRRHRDRESSPRATWRDRRVAAAVASKTRLCRRWFGEFIPIVRFPSLAEVEELLMLEYQQAQAALAETEVETFSNVFVSVLRTLVARRSLGSIPASVPASESSETVLMRIQEYLEELGQTQSVGTDVYASVLEVVRGIASLRSEDDGGDLHEILSLYESTLRERVNATRRVFSVIDVFEGSVNRFLEGKRVSVRPSKATSRRAEYYRGRGTVLMEGFSHPHSLRTLSSGERQVVTLLFSATHMTAFDGVVLVDEPEISLHVDWQRVILSELAKQANDRQIIACTHSPEVAAEHPDALIRVLPSATLETAMAGDQIDDADEEEV